jgi:hypothetical protein
MAFPTQLVVGVLAGGLAGSVFTWWVNHPRPSVISYQVTSTTLGGVKGLIPELRIKIGRIEIETVHIHTVELISQSGPYVEKVESVIPFAQGTRFYGQVVAEAPSPVQHIVCETVTLDVKCSAGPFTGKGERYRVSIASDQQKAPNAFLQGRGIEFGPWKPEGSQAVMNVLVYVLSIASAGLAVFLFFYTLIIGRRWRRKGPDRPS